MDLAPDVIVAEALRDSRFPEHCKRLDAYIKYLRCCRIKPAFLISDTFSYDLHFTQGIQTEKARKIRNKSSESPWR